MQETKCSTSSAKVVWELPDEETQWDDLWENWDRRKDTDDFIYQVERGIQGLNVGMSNGLPRLSEYIYGTQRGRYYLLGAESGVGKTTLGDFMYLYNLWLYCRKQGIRLYVKYFSFELSAIEKKARWVSLFLYHIYQVSIPADYIMGRIPGMLVSDENKQKIMKAYAAVEEMMQCIAIYDSVLHPTGILNKLVEDHYEKIGAVLRDAPKDDRKKGYIKGFKPKDPSAVTIVIHDHMALTHEERGLVGTKAVIDRTSMYYVQLRNLFSTTICAIQQFNTEMTTSQRERKKDQAVIIPQRVDFGDSKYTYRDADVVLGLVSPKQAMVDEYFKYRTDKLKMSFVACHLMKNRYGAANKMLPLFLNPIAGYFFDLPLEPESSQAMTPYYQEAQRLDDITRDFAPRKAAA